jgi:hypothetical protein
MSQIPSFRGAGEAFLRLERLSTATTVSTVSYAQAGALLLYNGQAAAARIMLPRAEDGLIYRIALDGNSATSAILIGATSGQAGAQDIRYRGTTGGYVQAASTVDGGTILTFVGVSDGRYQVHIERGTTVTWNTTSTGA